MPAYVEQASVRWMPEFCRRESLKGAARESKLQEPQGRLCGPRGCCGKKAAEGSTVPVPQDAAL